jgi:hypothetical protein
MTQSTFTVIGVTCGHRVFSVTEETARSTEHHHYPNGPFSTVSTALTGRLR